MLGPLFINIEKLLSVDSPLLVLTDCQIRLNRASFLFSDSLREIPVELRQRFRGGQVNLDMEDHRDEDFSKPKLVFKAFGGEGQKLGRLENSFFIPLIFFSLLSSAEVLNYTVSLAKVSKPKRYSL